MLRHNMQTQDTSSRESWDEERKMHALHPAVFHYKIQHGGRVRELCVSENVAKDHLLPHLSWNVSSDFERTESSSHSGWSSFSKTAVTH